MLVLEAPREGASFFPLDDLLSLSWLNLKILQLNDFFFGLRLLIPIRI